MRVVEEQGWKEKTAEIGNSRLSGSRLIANAPVRRTATGGKAIIEAKQLASEAASCRDRPGADKPDSVTGWVERRKRDLLLFQTILVDGCLRGEAVRGGAASSLDRLRATGVCTEHISMAVFRLLR